MCDVTPTLNSKSKNKNKNGKKNKNKIILLSSTLTTFFNYSTVQEHYFLTLRDKNCKPLQPSYSKSGS